MKTWWKLWCINVHTKKTQAATKNLMAVTVPSLSILLHPRLLAVVPVTEIKTVRSISSTKVSSAAQRKPIEPSTPWGPVFQGFPKPTEINGGIRWIRDNLATKVRNQRSRMKTNKTKTKHASCEDLFQKVGDCWCEVWNTWPEPFIKDLRAQVLASQNHSLKIHPFNVQS